jgi:hypothetical protein
MQQIGIIVWINWSEVRTAGGDQRLDQRCAYGPKRAARPQRCDASVVAAAGHVGEFADDRIRWRDRDRQLQLRLEAP